MAVIGLDFGLKRTGLAISSADNSFAMPLCTLPTSEVPQYLQQLQKEEGVELIVLGFPLSLRGHENEMTANVRAFQQKLIDLGFSVVVFDERNSTNKANTKLYQAGWKGIQRKKVKDEIAATVILDDYLQLKYNT